MGVGMILFDGGLGVVLFALWVFCIIDVITTPEFECRNLPKPLWLILVIILPDIGSIAWLVAGRTWKGAASSSGLPYKGNRGHQTATRYPEYDRPGRRMATNPDDDEAFLAGLRARAEEQRRRARDEQRRNEGEPPNAL
jgi:hypothetical protein